MERFLLEFTFAAVIVILLMGLSAYFGWKQWQALWDLRRQEDLPADDRRYHLHQAWRRLSCSVLMTAFAGMLAGWYLLGLNRQAVELGQGKVAEAAVDPATLEIERRRIGRIFGTYWIVAILILLAMVCLALVDFWAIRRYGLRHYRQIQSDRRAMLEQEVAVLRSQRNGHG